MPNFRHRLNARQQRQYDRSNGTSAIRLRVSPRLQRAVEVLREALATHDRARTERVSQVICDEVCRALQVRPPRVTVKGTRPHNARGELHGLYTHSLNGGGDTVEVWMTTARRKQTVAYKTFLRTLLHEVCHHLDYALLRLSESFHTDGFFKRESSLVRQLIPREVARRAGGPAAPPASRAAARLPP